MIFEEFLNYTLWNNSVQEYIIALIVFGLALILFRVTKYQIVKKIRSVAKRTQAEVDDLLLKVVDEIEWPFYIYFALIIALNFLRMPSVVNVFFTYATPIVAVLLVVKSIQQFLNYGIRKLAKEKKEETESSVINILGRLMKGALWAIAFVYIISAFGYDITTIVAGFGVIGIILAFGMQHVLGDIFAAFSIFYDRPFEIGDFIIVGDDLGVVKKVGIKSTRIQSLWGQEVVIPNTELTSSRINNYKKMERRRIQFNFGVEYDTSAEKLEKILKITQEIVDKIELAELDRVHFKEYGEYSLNYEAVYYVNTPDYNAYMSIQQEINLSLKKRFEKEGISFAYPTQEVIVKKSQATNKTSST